MSAQDHLNQQQFYHTGEDPRKFTGAYLHVGTMAAGAARHGGARDLYEVTVSPTRTLGSPSHPLDDTTANMIGIHAETRKYLGREPGPEDFDPDFEDAPKYAHDAGWTSHHDTVYYTNDVEDRGSLSAMVSPSAIKGVRKL